MFYKITKKKMLVSLNYGVLTISDRAFNKTYEDKSIKNKPNYFPSFFFFKIQNMKMKMNQRWSCYHPSDGK